MLVGDRSIDGTPFSEISKASEKKVLAQCDDCERKLVLIWHNYMISQKKKEYSGITLCRRCSSKRTGNFNGSGWNKGNRIPVENICRKDYISSDGYIMTFVYKENPKNKWECYKKKHIVIMEEYLGRKLEKGEVVHHIDGIRQNNSIENLVIMTEHKGHRLAHNSIQQIGYLLYRKGILGFDRNSGIYYIKEGII